MNKKPVLESETTTPGFWDSRWGDINSAVIQRGDGQVSDAILRFFDEHLKDHYGGSALEIGGAPGRYLGRLAIDHDLTPYAIDYSPIGCDQLRENFKRLGKEVFVIERNVLEEDAKQDEKFDIVFSLGLIEHFENIDEIIEKHVQYLKHDGTLILGVPNCLGIYHWFWKTLSPDLLSKHVLSTMKKEAWVEWEQKFDLTAVSISHVGGFHAGSLDKREQPGLHWKRLLAKSLRITFNRRFNILKHARNEFVASYLIGAFKLNEK